MKEYDKLDLEQGYGNRFVRFQDLLKNRVHDILLVSSLYDSFILGEDGQLYEMLLNEYIGLNLSHTPGLARVSSGREALNMLTQNNRFDLVITTLHLEDMGAMEFARQIRWHKIEMPVVLLTYDSRELNELMKLKDVSLFNKIFMWQGNFRILLAIVKCIEDLMNVKDDTELVGVQSIILIEDNVKFYSSYLPIIYTELMSHSQNVISEGINLAHKILRMRARPKILLCDTYEEAWDFYTSFHDSILGVISDGRFPRNGKSDPLAGIEFARAVKARHPDIPILIQSNDTEIEPMAYDVGASFLLKNSPVLLNRLRKFMKQYFSFGDFIFRMPDGREVDRARDLRQLRKKLATVPAESLRFHAERNHFSNWLKARTEFFLADKLRPRKVSDYKTVEDLRKALISYLEEYQISQHRGTVVDFDPDDYDPGDCFARIGGGSLGGKGRGLAFSASLINAYNVEKKFPGVNISVPPSVILGTDVFDEFLEYNNLSDFAINSRDDEEILKRFLKAEIPGLAEHWLREYLSATNYPLAVRSSSLLEDSQYQPFAGVYDTFMLSNNNNKFEDRVVDLLSAIKRVYASTFSNRAKEYIRVTPYRLEEEKMAVIIQMLIGHSFEDYFFPDFSGVARSHNFYPIPPMSAEDGIVSVALGLGATVVEGGATIRFCPKYPKHLVQFSSVDDALEYSQKEFFALDIPDPGAVCDHTREFQLTKLGLDIAERDGVLSYIGSTYSHENNAVYDGISRQGSRMVSFAPILKGNLFPLAAILDVILEMGRRGMSGPVEAEFSVNMSVPKDLPKEFRLLQLRPMVLSRESEQFDIGEVDEDSLICRSDQVLGNGVIEDIQDIVVVDRNAFDRSQSVKVAQEIGQLNHDLIAQDRPYLLIGVGRWGSADPWLGIPVQWEQISGARIIIESGFKDMKVTPSQGTHFFQNLNAFQVGYFTVNSYSGTKGMVNWQWLSDQKPERELSYTRHIRLKSSIMVKMDGRKNEGVVLKP